MFYFSGDRDVRRSGERVGEKHVVGPANGWVTPAKPPKLTRLTWRYPHPRQPPYDRPLRHYANATRTRDELVFLNGTRFTRVYSKHRKWRKKYIMTGNDDDILFSTPIKWHIGNDRSVFLQTSRFPFEMYRKNDRCLTRLRHGYSGRIVILVDSSLSISGNLYALKFPID